MHGRVLSRGALQVEDLAHRIFGGAGAVMGGGTVKCLLEELLMVGGVVEMLSLL